jgi:hypothetical protein
MKPLGSIWVVRRVWGGCTDTIRGCCNNPEGLNYGYMPSQRGSHVRELASGLRLGTAVPSQDLSGVWITVRG